MNKLQDTLVVFTSDHGELLGELERGGLYAHGSPVCPELVDVPTVFLGAGLPGGERMDRITSGVDLAPTVLSALGREIPSRAEGVDLWQTTPGTNRIVRSDFWAQGGTVEYISSSAWDVNGGVVHQFGSFIERLAFGVHRKLVKGAQTSANRTQLPSSLLPLLRTFGRSNITYGSPGKETQKSYLTSFDENDVDTDVEKVSNEQLEALGYLK